jgi:hypothetical protein
MIVQREELTAAERERMHHDKDMFQLQAVHTQKVRAMELEVAKIDAKWSSLLKLPAMIIRLPLYVVLGVAYCIAAARKHEPSEEFWRLLR